VDILCPKCKKFFKVQQNSALAQPAAARAAVNQALTSQVRPPSVQSTLPAEVPADSYQTGKPSSLAAKLAVLAGGSLVLLVGIMLLVWYFSGEEKTERSQPDNKQIAQPDPKDAPLKIDFSVKKPPQKKRPTGDAVPLIVLNEKEKILVNAMRQKGVDFLKRTQNSNGTWTYVEDQTTEYSHEMAAMAGLTLLECGVPADDPVIQKAAAFVRGHAQDMRKTYAISLYILFLDRLNDPQDEERIKQLAYRLAMGQSINGAWTYTVNLAGQPAQQEVAHFLTDLGTKSVNQFAQENPQRMQALGPTVKGLSILNTRDNQPPQYYKVGGDNSNTQFAILALWAARRHKVPSDHFLHLAAKRFRASQEADGRWCYRDISPEPNSDRCMTCVGLLGLALGYGVELPEAKRAVGPMKDPSIQKGLTFLGNYIDFPVEDPKKKPASVSIYFMWSVERIGVLFKLSKIDGKDWYRWGINILQHHQNEDGSWYFDRKTNGFAHSTDTCFSLLFLQQANLVQDLTDKLEEMTGPPSGQPAVQRKE